MVELGEVEHHLLQDFVCFEGYLLVNDEWRLVVERGLCEDTEAGDAGLDCRPFWNFSE